MFPGGKQGVATSRNSVQLLYRDDTLKISYSVRKTSYPAYTSLTPGPPGQGSELCTLDNRLYVQNNLSLKISSLSSNLC